jgi:hypothetical protein
LFSVKRKKIAVPHSQHSTLPAGIALLLIPLAVPSVVLPGPRHLQPIVKPHWLAPEPNAFQRAAKAPTRKTTRSYFT